MEAALPTDLLLNIANAASSAHPVDQTTQVSVFCCPDRAAKASYHDRSSAGKAQEMTMKDRESLTLRDLIVKAYIHVLKELFGRKAL